MRRALFVATFVVPLFAGAVSGAGAPAPQNLSLDNLVFSRGGATYSIAHVEVEASSVAAAEFAQLFADADSATIERRLAGFAARRVTIPSLSVETKTGVRSEKAAYRDIVFENIAGGRIGAMRAAHGEQSVEQPERLSQRYTWDRISAAGVDLRQLLHLNGSTRVDGAEPLKLLLDEEIMESARFEDVRDGFVATTGRVRLAKVSARALATPAAQLLERLGRLDPSKPESDATLSRELLDAMASREIGALELRDLALSGRGEPAGRPYGAKLARLGVTRVAGAVVGEIAAEGFSLAASDGGVLSTERVALRDLAVAPMLEGAYPRFSHVEAKALAADLPDPKTSGESRIKFSVAAIEADFSNIVDAWPTRFSTRLDHFAVDLAARGETPATAQFHALGYRALDLSAAASGEWREASGDFALGPTRVAGKDMGALGLEATLGNVSRATFSAAPLVSRAAALAVTARSVELTLDDAGLIERLLALEAKDQKTPLDKARADYARAAGAAVAELAGGGEKARRIGDALGAFILKPKRLRLRLSAPRGVNALDLMTRKPADIVESLDIEAVAGQ